MSDWKAHLVELREVVERSEVALASMPAIAGAFVDCLKKGNKVLAAGNGGSCCDAMHLVEELVGKYSKPRRALPAICLGADPSIMTCVANDWDYNAVFSRQVEAHARPGDFLVVFTSSGNSENLIRAVEAAKKAGTRTLALIGKDGGKLKGLAEFELIIPSNTTARVQEMHTWVLHELLEAVEEAFPS